MSSRTIYITKPDMQKLRALIAGVQAGSPKPKTNLERLEKELVKVDRQIDKKVSEIQEIEDLLFRIEQYKAANNIR